MQNVLTIGFLGLSQMSRVTQYNYQNYKAQNLFPVCQCVTRKERKKLKKKLSGIYRTRQQFSLLNLIFIMSYGAMTYLVSYKKDKTILFFPYFCYSQMLWSLIIQIYKLKQEVKRETNIIYYLHWLPQY